MIIVLVQATKVVMESSQVEPNVQAQFISFNFFFRIRVELELITELDSLLKLCSFIF
jgi:hypothetical protein